LSEVTVKLHVFAVVVAVVDAIGEMAAVAVDEVGVVARMDVFVVAAVVDPKVGAAATRLKQFFNDHTVNVLLLYLILFTYK